MRIKNCMLNGLFALVSASAAVAGVDRSSLETARDNLLRAQKSAPGGMSYWNYPINYGTHYISQTILVRDWMGKPYSGEFKSRAARLLLSQRLTDGSWKALPEANLPTGQIDATIFNYWALKTIYGAAWADKNLARTRDWIVKNGGLDAAESPLKIMLCLFGNYTWSFIPGVPKMFFGSFGIVTTNDFALWLQGAILPVSYFKSQRLHRDLGPRYSLAELFTDKLQKQVKDSREELKATRKGADFYVEKMRATQEPAGNWGASVVTTWLTAMALTDYNSKVKEKNNDAQLIAKALKRIDHLMIENGDMKAFSAHDGHFWDTAWALVALGETSAALREKRDAVHTRAADYLVKYQTQDGGFGFGKDFLRHADADDTAVVLLALSLHGKRYEKQMARAVTWLEQIQNKDGGFPAFTRGVAGTWVTSLFLKKVYDPEYLFDRSTSDVTGHVLEALGALGHTAENSKMVQRAQKYLLKNLVKSVDGKRMWRGRWGVNYIYGTATAVSGLVRSSSAIGGEEIREALDWLESRQNRDGGLGESVRSYAELDWAGRGQSTVTQTAWALTAWIDGGRAHSQASRRAAEFLVAELRKGEWKDRSLVGTGIPGLEYIDYPSYPKIFPLIALARYSRALENR